MTEEKAISVLEYTKHIVGTSDQGAGYHPNANTIAIDMGIQAIRENRELKEQLAQFEIKSKTV